MKFKFNLSPFSKRTLDYFYKEFGIEVFVYPVFKRGKCGYDSFTKIGYHYDILVPNSGTKSCYHIDQQFYELFPENLLDMNDPDLNTFKKIEYNIYKSKGAAEKKALEFLIKNYG